MNPLIFHEAAQTEADEAIEYYNAQLDDLGLAFEQELLRVVKDLQKHPKRWPFFEGTRVRHRLLNRFPYTVFFAESRLAF